MLLATKPKQIPIPATRELLDQFSRDELRDYADQLGCDKGRMKQDTIHYLLASGRAALTATLGNQ